MKNEIEIEISLKEIYTIIPLAKFGFIGSVFWIEAGITDYNFWGNKTALGGYYRYYERHSIEVFYNNPFLFDKHWGLIVDAGWLGTIEPTDTFGDTIVRYSADRRKGNLLASYSFTLKQSIQFGIGYLDDLFIKLDDIDLGPNRENQRKVLFKANYLIDHIDYDQHLLEGLANTIFLEAVYDLPDQFNIFKVYNQFKQYFRFLPKDTLAYRVQLGIFSDIKSPYPPFVVDSFLNIRGAGNRITRGYFEATINLEYRYIAFEISWLAFQLVTFSDNILLLSELNQSSSFHFMGGGVRLIFKRFYNAIILFDYGVNILDYQHRGFLFKLGQYF